jgi:hypothetical protein
MNPTPIYIGSSTVWFFIRLIEHLVVKAHPTTPDPKMVYAMDTSSETLVPIHELVRSSTERLEADFSRIETKIHRFPRDLRSIGDRYIVPSFVALGPYHHGLPHLQEAEEVKHAATHYFCAKLGKSVEHVYGKILSIAGTARGCYADDAVACFSNAEFAAMMFLDGCFLLWYAFCCHEPALLYNRMTLSTGPCMLRDIFLLENQLPWLVLEVLTENEAIDIFERFISDYAGLSNIERTSKTGLFLGETKPPHLLGLLRCGQISGMTTEDTSYVATTWAMASSAIELAEMGIHLKASNKTCFADMSIEKRLIFGELSLTPLFLNDVNACWLVNMAAFEACTSTSSPSDGFVISSYLSFLAMLMDKEEDVHQLRAKHLLRSFLSNQEMVDFFKGLARHLRLGHRYFVLVAKIYDYKRERLVRIAIHKFIYNNFKTIVALLSIAGVLAGIFKTLLSLKQHQQ